MHYTVVHRRTNYGGNQKWQRQNELICFIPPKVPFWILKHEHFCLKWAKSAQLWAFKNETFGLIKEPIQLLHSARNSPKNVEICFWIECFATFSDILAYFHYLAFLGCFFAVLQCYNGKNSNARLGVILEAWDPTQGLLGFPGLV